MKKLLLLLSLPLLTITFTACDKDEPNYEQLIVGTWEFDKVIQIESEYPDEDWTVNLKSAKLNPNKTFTLVFGDAYEEFITNGTYTVFGNKITFSYEEDGEDYSDTMEIVSIDYKACVLKMNLIYVLQSPPTPDVTYTAVATFRILKVQ